MFMITLLFLLVNLNTDAFAADPGYCGQIDFSSISNTDLENITYFNNKQHVQCGFSGENLKICSSCTNQLSEKAMQVLRPMIGNPNHLKWHDNWHQVRALTENPSDSSYEKYQKIGLLPQEIKKEDFLKAYVYEFGGELAGENFFYMHRMMYKMIQFELSMNQLPCLMPWTNLPSSVTDKDWPVPRPVTIKDTEKLNRFKSQFLQFKNRDYLKKVSLNHLGKNVEFTLHRDLHAFYRGQPKNGKACSPEALKQDYCDDLLPNATSPLNKYFWGIHSLVDELLGQWLLANDFQEIAIQCHRRPNCYEWKATWVGKYPQQ